MVEYRPGFYGWLLTVFIAAGFGNIVTDWVASVLSEASKTNGKLVLLDGDCWFKSEGKPRIDLCEFVYENDGGRPVIVTAVRVGDKVVDRFESNLPGGRNVVKSNIEIGNFAVVRPAEYLSISIAIRCQDWGKKDVCLMHKDVTLHCTRDYDFSVTEKRTAHPTLVEEDDC